VDKIRTVSDSKRAFYARHTRPLNSVYRRVVEELLVEMHLLSVNVDFRYDSIYALGVFTSFERFMQGYQPQSDIESIFHALCQAVGSDYQQIRQDAERVLSAAKQLSITTLFSQIKSSEEDNLVVTTLRGISNNPKFKYSRLFGIGIYTILVEANPELAKDKDKRNEILKQVSELLHLPQEKIEKDLDIYRSNLEKMEQLLGVIEEALQAERKKREQKEQGKTETHTGN
jgi:photosystem II biogenesis protein Psp29